jgi:hypothetical protein
VGSWEACLGVIVGVRVPWNTTSIEDDYWSVSINSTANLRRELELSHYLLGKHVMQVLWTGGDVDALRQA